MSSTTPISRAGHNYLVGISDIDEPEVFKIALEYWLRLANDLYALECTYAATQPALGLPPASFDSTGLLRPTVSGLAVLLNALNGCAR